MSSKEAWPILWAFQRLDWLFHGHSRPVQVFCDHKNLASIMDPSGAQAQNKNTLTRLYRWALQLSEIRYRVYHIPGQFNVFAELLTRWGARVENLKVRLSSMTVSLPSEPGLADNTDYIDFIYDRVRLLHRPDFSWPTWNCIIAAQRRAIGKQPRLADHLYVADGLFFHSKTRRIWIPSSSLKLRTRIVVIAHTLSGHGSVDTTLARINTAFHAPGIKPLVQKFVKLCLHCESGPRLIASMALSLTATHAVLSSTLIISQCLTAICWFSATIFPPRLIVSSRNMQMLRQWLPRLLPGALAIHCLLMLFWSQIKDRTSLTNF